MVGDENKNEASFLFSFKGTITDDKSRLHEKDASFSVLFATITREAIARDEAPRSFQVMMERLISCGQSSGRVDENVESIRKRFRCGRQRVNAHLLMCAQSVRNGERACTQTVRGGGHAEDGALVRRRCNARAS